MVNWSAPAPFPGSLGVALAPQVLHPEENNQDYEHSTAASRSRGTDERNATHEDEGDA